MSFQDMAWAVEQKCETAGQKLVLLMLANHANGHTRQCNPSHKRLADECSMGVSTLKRNIASLAEAGYLSIEARSHDGVSLPNQYKLTPLNLGGVGPNRTDLQPKLGGGVGPNRATKQEVKPGIEPKKKKKEGSTADLPDITFNGTAFENLSDSQIAVWSSAYPAISVLAETLKAAAWLDANPANTKSDYKRFLNGWLTRAQDKAPRLQDGEALARQYTPARRTPPTETFAERDAANKRRDWEVMTGRVWPTNDLPSAAAPFVIDAEANEPRRIS